MLNHSFSSRAHVGNFPVVYQAGFLETSLNGFSVFSGFFYIFNRKHHVFKFLYSFRLSTNFSNFRKCMCSGTWFVEISLIALQPWEVEKKQL